MKLQDLTVEELRGLNLLLDLGLDELACLHSEDVDGGLEVVLGAESVAKKLTRWIVNEVDYRTDRDQAETGGPW